MKYLIGVLEDLGAPYMVVGSFASSAYGDPRSTRDIDIVVDLSERHVSSLLLRFPPDEFDMSKEAAFEAIRRKSQFNIIHSFSGEKIDVIIARGDAWGREQISRRERTQIIPGLEGFCARPEDVILGKMQYSQEGGSEKHLRDIASMLTVSGDLVDRLYVEKWAERLGLMEVWQVVVRRIEKK